MNVQAHVGAGRLELRQHAVPAIGPGEMWSRAPGSDIARSEPGAPPWVVLDGRPAKV